VSLGYGPGANKDLLLKRQRLFVAGRNAASFVSKRKYSPYRSGRSSEWLKMKNPVAPAVKREAEEDWGKERWR